jgi:two-component system, chemotaxis family, CheB/CheR fusion protein
MALAQGPGKKILVVEDNPEAAGSLGMLLRLDGHEVRTAGDGPAALAAVRCCHPEAVLLDIGLPGMDGCEVAQRLRREPGLEHVLIIAVTGRDQDAERRRALDAGFDVYLVKPLAMGEIKQLMLRLRR